MALPFAALAAGSLLGGGGSNTLTNTGTFSQSLSNEFLPVANFNIGGSVSAQPTGGTFGGPDTRTGVAVTPTTQGGVPLSAFGGSIPDQNFSGGGSFNIQENLPLLAVGAAALWFLMKDK